MKTFLYVIGAFFWVILVFVVSFYVTFPSRVIADRIRYEVPNVLGPDYSADVGSVKPWWFGLSSNDIKIYKAPGRVRGADPEEEPAGAQLVGLLGNMRMRIAPFRSLFRRAPYVSGSVTLTEGSVNYAIGTSVEQRGGDVTLSDVVLSSTGMPLADLFVLVPDLTATGVGTVDLDVDLHAGETGMRDASGHFSFGGTNLVLSDIEIPGMGALGMEVPISELLLAADVVDGVATISSGRLQSDIATVEITGTVTLRDPIDRSAVDIQIAMSNLGEVLAPYKGFLSDAAQPDGSYHYSCRGVLSRMGASSCSAGSRERRVTSRPPSPGSPMSSSPMPRSSSPGNARDAETDEERERRRDEIRERLRQKREEREAERAGTPAPVREEVGEDEEPEPEEEPHVEEEEIGPDEGDIDLEEPQE